MPYIVVVVVFVFLALKFCGCLLVFAVFCGNFGICASVFGKQFAVGCDTKKFQSFPTIVIYAINSTRTSWLLLKGQTNSIAAVETLAATFNE